MATYTYFLARSALKISGTRTVVTDGLHLELPQTSVDGLSVELVQIADRTREVIAEIAHGDRDFDLSITADGRLQALTYKSVGAGTAVVSGAAKFIGWLGSIALAVAGRAAPPAIGTHARELWNNDIASKVKNARALWNEANTALEKRRADYAKVAADASAKLLVLRESLVTAGTVEIRELEVKIRSLETVQKDAAAEVARIEKIYLDWRAAQRETVQSKIEERVLVNSLPSRTSPGFVPPTVPKESDDPGWDLWDSYGIYLETAERAVAPAVVDDGSALSTNQVHWREPREVELWVWKRAGETMELVSTEIIRINDDFCRIRALELNTKLFGTNGGSITFNEDGSPSKVTMNEESPISSILKSLGAVADDVGSGVTAAKGLVDNVINIRDAQADRDKAAAERDLAEAKARLELKGVEATADDYADLQRAEQAVKLKTANTALAPSAAPSSLEVLKTELDRVRTQNSLDAARREAATESSLADVKLEVARLQAEVARVEALAKLP